MERTLCPAEFHNNSSSSHLDAVCSFISTQFNSDSISISISSLNQIFGLTIPVLLSLLQIKKTDPFTTHPTTMRVALSSAVLFYLANIVVLRFPRLRRHAAAVIASIVNASVASLASILFPDSLRPLVFALFGMLYAAELLRWFYNELIMDEESGVWRIWNLELFSNIRTALNRTPVLPQSVN